MTLCCLLTPYTWYISTQILIGISSWLVQITDQNTILITLLGDWTSNHVLAPGLRIRIRNLYCLLYKHRACYPTVAWRHQPSITRTNVDLQPIRSSEIHPHVDVHENGCDIYRDDMFEKYVCLTWPSRSDMRSPYFNQMTISDHDEVETK